MSSIDILLVSPPLDGVQAKSNLINREIQYNFGLCCLATTLRSAGFSAGIVDGFASNLSEGDILNYIKKFEPKIIGFSTLTSNSLRSLYSILKKLKNSKYHIIVGGHHFTVDPQIIKILDIKYGLIGEADYSIVDLCNYLLKRKSDVNIEKIEGLVYNAGGNLNINKYNGLEDLDSLPTPSFEHFLSRISKGTAYLSFSRGCKFRCFFCSRYGYRGKYSYRNARKVFEDILTIFRNNQHQYLVFTDETLTMEKEPVLELCKLLQNENLNIPFGASTRIDCIDEEILEIMVKSGLKTLHLGIESGVEDIRIRIGKPFKDEECKKIIKLCKKLGIQTICFFMIGLPEETISDIKKTIEFIKLLSPDDIFLTPYIMVPGSILYERLIKERYIKETIWEDYIKGESDLPVYVPKYLTMDTLRKLEIRTYRKFYINFKTIKKIILNKDRRKLALIILGESIKKEILYPIMKILISPIIRILSPKFKNV